MIRFCRRSNDRAYIALVAIWFAFAILFTLVLAGTYRHPIACLIMTLCATVAWSAVINGVYGFYWPYNIVFEITETDIRFGRDDKPHKMTVFSRDVIRGVRIDFAEREILLDVGTQWLKPCLSNGFLTAENLQDVKRFMTENWPATPMI